MTKIRKVILFYGQIDGIEPHYMDVLERSLSPATLEKIKKSNISPLILGKVLKLVKDQNCKKMDYNLNMKSGNKALIV